MATIKAAEARSKLYKLLDQAAESHGPIQITGKRSNLVLIAEEYWRSIQETYTCYPFTACGPLSEGASRLPWRNAARSPEGEMESCLHPASAKEMHEQSQPQGRVIHVFPSG